MRQFREDWRHTSLRYRLFVFTMITGMLVFSTVAIVLSVYAFNTHKETVRINERTRQIWQDITNPIPPLPPQNSRQYQPTLPAVPRPYGP